MNKFTDEELRQIGIHYVQSIQAYNRHVARGEHEPDNQNDEYNVGGLQPCCEDGREFHRQADAYYEIASYFRCGTDDNVEVEVSG